MLDGPRLDRCLNLLSLVCFCWFLSAQSSYWVQCFRRRALPALELGGGGGRQKKKKKNWHPPSKKKKNFFFFFLAPAPPPPGSRSSLVCFCWFLSAQSSYWVQCFRRRALPALELGGGGGGGRQKKKKLTPPPARPPPPPGSRSSLVCFCWFLSAQSSYWVQCFRRRALPALELGGGGGAPKKKKIDTPPPNFFFFFFLAPAPPPPPGIAELLDESAPPPAGARGCAGSPDAFEA